MAMASAALRASRRCAVRPCARGGHPTGLPKASARTTHGRRGWDARQAAQAGSGERPGRVLDPEPLAREMKSRRMTCGYTPAWCCCWEAWCRLWSERGLWMRCAAQCSFASCALLSRRAYEQG